MLKRLKEYQDFTCRVRKVFSEVQKRKLACKQQYKCVGSRCQGRVLLPSVWELDHIEPLFVLLERYSVHLPRLFGSQTHLTHTPDLPAFLQTLEAFIQYCSRPANVQIICARCHAHKTQQERIAFYENERLHKFKAHNTGFVPASLYYTPPAPPPRPAPKHKIRTSRFFRKKRKVAS